MRLLETVNSHPDGAPAKQLAREALAHWRDAMWSDFRETGHTHALGQCLLSQLDEQGHSDHPDRHPVQPVPPCSVSDRRALLERLASTERMQTVVERQEYALGTVCAAIPITTGSGAAAMGISLPLHQEDGCFLRSNNCVTASEDFWAP